MFDALIQLVRTAQASASLPEGHGGVPTVVVTVDHDDLRKDLAGATTTLGEDLDPATVRRLACDADLIPAVLGSGGRVLEWAGRTGWSPPPSGPRSSSATSTGRFPAAAAHP